MSVAGRAIELAVRGTELSQADAAIVLLHGRGSSAADILSLEPELSLPGLALVAPEASGNTWYPSSFLAPLQANQPALSRSLEVVGHALSAAAEEGVHSDKVILLGFSQGACLALEYAVRNPRRYGAVVGLTGGLIGPPGTTWNQSGSFEGTPVYLGSSDPDPHVPWVRVEESANVLTRMGAEVGLERFPGRPHAIHREQLDAARRLTREVLSDVEATRGR